MIEPTDDDTGALSGASALAAAPAVSAPAGLTELDGSAAHLAPSLLGARLVTVIGSGAVTVRITEVEAYEGTTDPASHAYRGPSARNGTMFGPPGHLYVYRHLGIHHCANVVVGPAGTPTGILIRAGEVIDGADLAWARRTATGVCRAARDLARGPGRLAVALGLTTEHDGLPVIGAAGAGDSPIRLYLAAGPVPAVSTGPRIGIGGAGSPANRWPWRFWITGDDHVSGGR